MYTQIHMHNMRWVWCVQRKQQTIQCPRSSMRSEDAGPYLRNFFNGLAASIRSVTTRTCGGNVLVVKDIHFSLRSSLSMGRTKFEWVDKAPYCVARADNPADAQVCIDQLNNASLATLDPVSASYRDQLLPSLQRAVDGGSVPRDLANEIHEVRNCPLEEGPGEHCHRITNLTRQRSSAAKQAWCIASTRLRQNLNIAMMFCTQYGERGKGVFRFEWRRYKRLLRGSRARRTQPVKLATKIFYRILYRLDQDSAVDWGVVVGAPPVEVAATTSGNDRMQNEYAQSVPPHTCAGAIKLIL